MWRGDTVLSHAVKMIQTSNGSIYGVVGSCRFSDALFAWARSGEEGAMPAMRDGDNSCSMIRITRARVISLIDDGAVLPTWAMDYCAIGAGAAVALGALHAGASAPDAVRAALVHSDAARGDVQILRL